MIDVDGTLIQNRRDGIPSPRVTKAIEQAKKRIHIGVATARPLFLMQEILSHLSLSGPLILNNGAQIIDAHHKKILWEQKIREEDIDPVCAVFQSLKIPIIIHDRNGDHVIAKQRYDRKSVYNIFSINSSPKKGQQAAQKLSHIPTIVVHTVSDWEEGKVSIVVSHAQATKQHGIFEVAKILGIETHEIIGIGDGYNDFPLLMACGLKVAMGNAVEELKAIAHYVAPSVDDDGVADVIEKFVL